MFYPTTGWMLFDTQDLLQPPIIHQSGNGWIYKPDEARTPQEIKRGTNKAWPRTRHSSTAHADWHKEYMQDQLSARNWKLPTKIEKPQPAPQRAGGDSLAIHWDSQPWGWQHIAVSIREPSSYSYGDKKITIAYYLSSHPAAEWYEGQRVESIYGGQGQRSGTIQTSDRNEVREAVRRWMADPWGETVANISDVSLSTFNIMKPPIEKMRSIEYLDDASDDLNFYGRRSGSAEFWTKGKIEEVMKSDVAWKALQRIIKAFEFTGYTVRVHTEYSYRDAEDVAITGIEIVIPEDPNSTNRSRRSGHKITIDRRDGINMTCGFVQDEAAWLEREMRKAKEHMTLLEEDLFTEFSIDLNE